MTDWLILSALNYHFEWKSFSFDYNYFHSKFEKKMASFWQKISWLEWKMRSHFFNLRAWNLVSQNMRRFSFKFNLPFLYYYLLVLIPYLCVFRRSNDCSSNSGGSLHHHHGLISSKAFADSDDGMNAYGQSSPRSSGE